jgi:hypothetical protein
LPAGTSGSSKVPSSDWNAFSLPPPPIWMLKPPPRCPVRAIVKSVIGRFVSASSTRPRTVPAVLSTTTRSWLGGVTFFCAGAYPAAVTFRRMGRASVKPSKRKPPSGPDVRICGRAASPTAIPTTCAPPTGPPCVSRTNPVTAMPFARAIGGHTLSPVAFTASPCAVFGA